MSIASIGPALGNLTRPDNVAGAAGKGAKGSDQSSVVNTVTTTAADGSTTTVTTYADGTTSTSSTPPTGPATSQDPPPTSGRNLPGGLFDPGNYGQAATLLAAQEQARAA